MNNKPLYLFVCVENACRSQMAQGLFNALTKNARAESAGTKSSGKINPMAIEVLKERGISTSSHYSKKLTSELVNEAYRVITMGCIHECPYAPSAKTIKWDVPDPKGKEKSFFIQVRDIIEIQILDLLQHEHLIQ